MCLKHIHTYMGGQKYYLSSNTLSDVLHVVSFKSLMICCTYAMSARTHCTNTTVLLGMCTATVFCYTCTPTWLLGEIYVRNLYVL